MSETNDPQQWSEWIWDGSGYYRRRGAVEGYEEQPMPTGYPNDLERQLTDARAAAERDKGTLVQAQITARNALERAEQAEAHANAAEAKVDRYRTALETLRALLIDVDALLVQLQEAATKEEQGEVFRALAQRIASFHEATKEPSHAD